MRHSWATSAAGRRPSVCGQQDGMPCVIIIACGEGVGVGVCRMEGAGWRARVPPPSPRFATTHGLPMTTPLAEVSDASRLEADARQTRGPPVTLSVGPSVPHHTTGPPSSCPPQGPAGTYTSSPPRATRRHDSVGGRKGGGGAANTPRPKTGPGRGGSRQKREEGGVEPGGASGTEGGHLASPHFFPFLVSLPRWPARGAVPLSRGASARGPPPSTMGGVEPTPPDEALAAPNPGPSAPPPPSRPAPTWLPLILPRLGARGRGGRRAPWPGLAPSPLTPLSPTRECGVASTFPLFNSQQIPSNRPRAHPTAPPSPSSSRVPHPGRGSPPHGRSTRTA
jgi:hypothetical protein